MHAWFEQCADSELSLWRMVFHTLDNESLFVMNVFSSHVLSMFFSQQSCDRSEGNDGHESAYGPPAHGVSCPNYVTTIWNRSGRPACPGNSNKNKFQPWMIKKFSEFMVLWTVSRPYFCETKYQYKNYDVPQVYSCLVSARSSADMVSSVEVTEIILDVGLANERCRYNVNASLIGWVQTQNDPWVR